MYCFTLACDFRCVPRLIKPSFKTVGIFFLKMEPFLAGGIGGSLSFHPFVAYCHQSYSPQVSTNPSEKGYHGKPSNQQFQAPLLLDSQLLTFTLIVNFFRFVSIHEKHEIHAYALHCIHAMPCAIQPNI